MKIVLLLISMLIFILVQIGAFPLILVAFPVLPFVSTVYVYFILMLPFLWLWRHRRVPPWWKVAALMLPVIAGVAVPLFGQVVGEAAVLEEFSTQPTITFPTPKSVEVIVPEPGKGRELFCGRLCQLLVTSPEIQSVRLTWRDKNGFRLAVEVALAASGQCVPLSDSEGIDPRMLEQQARGLCPVITGTTVDGAELSLVNERTGHGPVDRWFLVDLPPSSSTIENVHTLTATPRGGVPVSWTQVNYSVPAAPLRLKLMSCYVFYCPGPSAWVRDKRTLNAFDEVSLVRRLLSLGPASESMSAEQLALMVVESPREQFTPEQIKILSRWAALGWRGTHGAQLTDADARIIASLIGDSRLDGRITGYIQSVLRAYPAQVDLHFDALLDSVRLAHSEGRPSMDDAMLVAGQDVLESHRGDIEAYLASLGPDPSVAMLGLAGRLGKDLTEHVAAAITADQRRAAIVLACLSGPPLSAELTAMIVGVIPRGTGNDARYALQALAIRGQLEAGTEAAVAANLATRDWIKSARYERYEGDARMCSKPPL